MPDRSLFHIDPRHQPILRQVGLDADAIFTHPQIKVWRSIADRENCTLDFAPPDGPAIRWHIKRYHPVRPGVKTPAELEVAGLRALMDHRIPTMSLIGWGRLADRRSFVIFDHLAGYGAADTLLESGLAFGRILEPTADLAARLHAAGLHHRDLYLNHFFINPDADPVDLKLIDVARVRRLPWLFRQRWIIKDLAQFWYSTLKQRITDEQRQAWIERYAQQRRLTDAGPLVRKIRRKLAWMACHDAKLHRRQPHRNIRIPGN